MMKTPFQTSIQLACALALGTAASSALAAVRYECQALETGHYVFAWALALNSAGEVVGSSDFGSGPSSRDAARWSADGAVTRLGNLGEFGAASDINDNGVIVGYSQTENFTAFVPTTWNGTIATALPLLGGDTDGDAHGVNNRGAIVGDSSKMFGHTHAVLWRNGKVIELDTPGGPNGRDARDSIAYGINSQGAIVGKSDIGETDNSHAVWWDTNLQVHDLGTLAGADRSEASAINDKGVIVGYSERGVGDVIQHAVAWENGVMRELKMLPGHLQSHATAINRSGTVVGRGTSDVNYVSRLALVWPSLNHAPRDLNKVLTNRCKSGGNTYLLTGAMDINRDGVIAVTGEYVDASDDRHFAAFKLVPVPQSAVAK